MKVLCSECGKVISYDKGKVSKNITSYDICKKCKAKLPNGGKND